MLDKPTVRGGGAVKTNGAFCSLVDTFKFLTENLGTIDWDSTVVAFKSDVTLTLEGALRVL